MPYTMLTMTEQARIYWDRRRPGGTRQHLLHVPTLTLSPAEACRRDGGGPSENADEEGSASSW